MKAITEAKLMKKAENFKEMSVKIYGTNVTDAWKYKFGLARAKDLCGNV